MAFAPYKLETDLCAEFIEFVSNNGWDVYPETNDWDIFLVSKKDTKNIKYGDQVGIEAKLKPNLKVLDQAYIRSKYYSESGPNFICTLTPLIIPEFARIAAALGLIPVPMFQKITEENSDPTYKPVFSKFDSLLTKRNRRIYNKQLWVPEVKIDVEAGAAGPRKVTQYKIKMVKHCIFMMNNNGMCHSEDFSNNNVGSYRTWLAYGWIKDTGMRSGSKKLWILDPKSKDRPDRKWPEVLESLLEQ